MSTTQSPLEKQQQMHEPATKGDLSNFITTADVDAIQRRIISETNQVVTEVEQRLTQKVEDTMRNLSPTTIKLGNKKPRVLTERLHQAFEETLKLANMAKQVFLSGPAGTGKTTIAAQVAKAFGLEWGHLSCTMGMSEAHILGRMDAHGNYMPSEFVTIYENGGVFLFDEVDAADANTMLIINSALANGWLSVPNRKDNPRAKRHKDTYIICAANTWGFGSNEYAGRNILDAAFLDRFVASKLFVKYDEELERNISADYPYMAMFFHYIRKNCEAHKLRKVISTRAIDMGMRAMYAGYSLKEYVFNRFFIDWTPEEINKALKGPKDKHPLDPDKAPKFEPKDQQGDQDEEEDGEGEGQDGGEGKEGDVEGQSEGKPGKGKNGKDGEGEGKDGKNQGKGKGKGNGQETDGKGGNSGSDNIRTGSAPDVKDPWSDEEEAKPKEGKGGGGFIREEVVMDYVLKRVQK